MVAVAHDLHAFIFVDALAVSFFEEQLTVELTLRFHFITPRVNDGYISDIDIVLLGNAVDPFRISQQYRISNAIVIYDAGRFQYFSAQRPIPQQPWPQREQP